MLNLTFATAPQLQQLLLNLDVLRHDILITAVSPQRECALRWEAMLSRLTELASLQNLSIRKSDLVRLLTSHHGIRLARPVQELINYRSTLATISELVPFTRPLSVATLATLTQCIVDGQPAASHTITFTSEADLRQLLSYLQVQRESPILQATIGAIAIHLLKPAGNASDLLAYATAYAFLTKYNYAFRGLVVLERIWNWHAPQVAKCVTQAQETGVLTEWISYAVTSLVSQLEEKKEQLTMAAVHLEMPTHYFELTDRQRRVLGFLEAPQIRITNREVQKLCKVSQITASRDLAKLTNLGLLAPHGKGRSVYYTKV